MMRVVYSMVLCVVLLGVSGAPLFAEIPSAVLQAEQERIAAIEKAKAPSISVFAKGGRGGGSGVVISPDGYALTNFHVAKPAGDYMQCSMPDGELYDAVIVGIDPTGDVALIKLFGRNDFPAAEMANSNDVRAGDWCFAIGNPFLLATDFQPTVTWGIVSGVHRYQYPAGTLLEYADCIQTDASINPGNSGGPLFNAKGQLIGINGRGSFEKRGRVNVGVGYAISINQIKHFLGYLKSGRIVDHATMGATVSTDDVTGAVLVTNILDSSDAYRRGLRYNDEIVSFGNRPISTVNGFKNVLGIFPKGWRVPLTYRREGKRYDILVRLTGVHSREELLEKIQKAPTPPDPGKKPGDRPDDEEKKPKTPRIPAPIRRALPGAKPMPKHVAAMFEARSGYSNYHFNKMHRERVWNAFLNASNAKDGFGEQTGPWTLEGEFTEGGTVAIRLENEAATATISGAKHTADLTQDLDNQLAPRGSGGLLTALALWRRMLTVGPEKFGEVYYLGKAPLLGREELVDILIGTYDVVEVRFFYSPETGQLVGMEFWSEASDRDPCEIYFDQYKDIEGRNLPGRMKVFYGDDAYGVIMLDKVVLGGKAGS
jgi:serine protease Do